MMVSVELPEYIRTLETLRSLPDHVLVSIFPNGIKRKGRPAMGFERRVYALDYSDTNWEGLEVRARGITLDEAIELQRLIDLGPQMFERTEDRKEDRKLFYELLEKMLVSWNRTDDGEPVPIDVKHLELEEFAMLQKTTTAYLRAVLTVPPPLSRQSSDGDTSEAEFNLMEALSESQES